jgi:hypothetical protein
MRTLYKATHFVGFLLGVVIVCLGIYATYKRYQHHVAKENATLAFNRYQCDPLRRKDPWDCNCVNNSTLFFNNQRETEDEIHFIVSIHKENCPQKKAKLIFFRNLQFKTITFL